MKWHIDQKTALALTAMSSSESRKVIYHHHPHSLTSLSSFPQFYCRRHCPTMFTAIVVIITIMTISGCPRHHLVLISTIAGPVQPILHLLIIIIICLAHWVITSPVIIISHNSQLACTVVNTDNLRMTSSYSRKPFQQWHFPWHAGHNPWVVQWCQLSFSLFIVFLHFSDQPFPLFKLAKFHQHNTFIISIR